MINVSKNLIIFNFIPNVYHVKPFELASDWDNTNCGDWKWRRSLSAVSPSLVFKQVLPRFKLTK